MFNQKLLSVLLVTVSLCGSLRADEELMKTHCSKCHNDKTNEGDFDLRLLGATPNEESLDHWVDSLDYVTSKEMPPEDESKLSDSDRAKLVAYLSEKNQKLRSNGKGFTKTNPSTAQQS